jgi:hypothetical protein
MCHMRACMYICSCLEAASNRGAVQGLFLETSVTRRLTACPSLPRQVRAGRMDRIKRACFGERERERETRLLLFFKRDLLLRSTAPGRQYSRAAGSKSQSYVAARYDFSFLFFSCASEILATSLISLASNEPPANQIASGPN